MFKCDFCGKCSALGEPCTKVITSKRQRVYKSSSDEPNSNAPMGWEIVNEKKACPTCASSVRE